MSPPLVPLEPDPYATVPVTGGDDPYAKVPITDAERLRARAIVAAHPDAVAVPPDPTLRDQLGRPIAMQITAKAPTPFEAAAAQLQHPELAQQGLVTPEPRLMRGLGDYYADDAIKQAMRGVLESGFATVQGATNLVTGGADSGPAQRIRALRENMRGAFGDPQTGLGTAANVVGNIGGTVAQFLVPGAAAARLAPALRGVPLLGRVAAAAEAPGLAGAAARVGINTAVAAPLDIAQSQSPEDAAATGLATLAETPGGRRLLGDENATAAAERLRAIGSDPVKAAFFQLMAGAVPNVAIEGVVQGARAVPAAVRAVASAPERVRAAVQDVIPDIGAGVTESATRDLAALHAQVPPTDPLELRKQWMETLLNERDQGETIRDFWTREIPEQRALPAGEPVPTPTAGEATLGPAIPMGPGERVGGAIPQPAPRPRPLLPANSAVREALESARGTSAAARAAGREGFTQPGAVISMEAQSSGAEGFVPKLAEAPTEYVAQLTREIDDALREGETGTVIDRIVEQATGAKLGSAARPARGWYAGTDNPNTLFSYSPDVPDEAIAMATALHSLVKGQDAGTWWRWHPEAGAGTAPGYVVHGPNGAPLSPDAVAELRAVILNDPRLQPLDGATIADGHLLFRNFTDVPEDEYRELLNDALARLSPGNDTEIAVGHFTGDYYSGSAAYLQALGRHPDALREAGRVLGERVAPLYERAARDLGDDVAAVGERLAERVRFLEQAADDAASVSDNALEAGAESRFAFPAQTGSDLPGLPSTLQDVLRRAATAGLKADLAAGGVGAAGGALLEPEDRLRGAVRGAGLLLTLRRVLGGHATPALATRTVREVAELLASKGTTSYRDAGYRQMLKAAVRRGLGDVLDALDKMPHAGQWYRASLERMNQSVREMLPATKDPSNMALFRAILAITSNGTNPLQNFKTAVGLFEKVEAANGDLAALSLFKGRARRVKTAKGGVVWQGARDDAIMGSPRQNTWEDHFRKLEEYLQGMPREQWADAIDGLVSERVPIKHTIRETGESVEIDSPRAVEMFGPKIGRFLANLSGSAQDVTVDKWAHRTLTKWLGYAPEFNLKGEQIGPTDIEGNVARLAIAKLARLVSERTGHELAPMDVQALLWYYEKQRYADLGAVDSGQIGYDDAARILAAEREPAAPAGHPGLGAGTTGTAEGPRAPAARAGAARAGRARARGAEATDAAEAPGVEKRFLLGTSSEDIAEGLQTGAKAAGRAAGKVLGVRPLSPEQVARSDAHFNFAKVALDPAGESALRERVDRVVQERGLDPKRVITHAETRELAQSLGLDAEQLTKAAERHRLSGAQMLAMRQLIADNTKSIEQRLTRLTTDAALDDAGRQQLLREVEALEAQTDALVAKYTVQRSQTGRDLNNMKIVANLSLDPALWLTRARKLLGGRPLTQEHITAIHRFINAEDRAGLAQYVAGLKKPSIADQLLSIWKAGLVTAPTTHAANILGNTTMAALETAKDVPATLMDALLSGMTGQATKDAHTLATVRASVRGAREGLREARQVMRGVPLGRDGSVKWEQAATRIELPGVGKHGNAFLTLYVQKVFGSLEAEDRVFRGMALRRSLEEQARVIAKNEGLTGAKAAARAQQLLQQPTDEMALAAIRDADYATFQDESALARAGQGFRRPLGVVGEVLAPFVRTPANVAMRTVEYSPAGFVMSANSMRKLIGQLRAGVTSRAAQRELAALQKLAAERFGRAAVGLVPIALGYVLHKHGLMSEGRPRAQAERDEMEVEGVQQNAVQLGGRWLSVQRISPFGNLMALGAAISAAKQNPENSALVAVGAGEASIGQMVTDQSFLKGVQQAQDLIQDPSREAKRFAQSLAGSVVPAVVGRAATAVDPVVREREGVLDAITARLPFASRTLPAKLDALGTPVRREGGVAALFDPTNASRDLTRTDPVRAALRVADVDVSRPRREAGETPEQYRARLAEGGAAIRERIADELQGVDPATLTPEERAELQRRLELLVRREKSTTSRRARREREELEEAVP